MTFKEHLYKIDRMKRLIRLQATGSPKELAAKLDVSESTLFRLLSELKDLGADIEFSRCRNSYRYCSSEDNNYFRLGRDRFHNGPMMPNENKKWRVNSSLSKNESGKE